MTLSPSHSLPLSVALWGTVAGLIHFVAIGLLYGNPVVDRLYVRAAKESPAYKVWASKPRYLVAQLLGTQVEIFVLALAFLGLRGAVAIEGVAGALILGLLLSAIRVYPRFWNMWIQTTYPNRLLVVEAVNGTLGTLLVAVVLQVLAVR